MSELTKLQKGWKIYKLGDLVDIIAGQAPPSSSYNKDGSGTSFLRVSEFGEKYPQSTYWTNKPLKFCKENDILLSVAGTIGDVNIADSTYAITRSIFALRIKNRDLDSNYLFYYLKTLKSRLQHASSGSSQKIITIKTIYDLDIPITNIENQKWIVSVLDKSNELIEKRKKTTHLANELIQACFTYVFGKIENLMDEEEHAKLHTIANLRGGITMNESRRAGDNKVPYITIRNLYREEFDFTDLRTISVTESDLQKWKLEYGDLCVLEGGDKDDVGRTAVYQNKPNPCVHQNHIFRVRLNTAILNPFFVSAYFNSHYVRAIFFKLAKATTGINTLNITELGRIEVPIPPMDKQLKFQEMYLKSKELQNSLRNEKLLLHLFNTLQDRLFSGMLMK